MRSVVQSSKPSSIVFEIHNNNDNNSTCGNKGVTCPMRPGLNFYRERDGAVAP